MRHTKLKHYRKRLLDERNSLVQQREHVLEAIPEQVHPPGENEIAPSEGIDVEMTLDQDGTSRLHDIDAALQLIKDGTFGMCSECGCEIPEDRLQEIPSARYCIRCEATRERV